MFESYNFKRQDQNLWRELKILDSDLVDFCTNDYLGLSQDEDYKKSFLKELRPASMGASSSRLVPGLSQRHFEYEKQAALFFKSEQSLLFCSGFQANLGFFSSLPAEFKIFSDQNNHASLIQAISLSACSKTIFKHNSIEDLETLLEEEVEGPKVIVIESVYSMEGLQTRLKDFWSLALKHDAFLYVDEAHSSGVFGEQGRGLSEEMGLDLDHPKLIRMHGMGKAWASQGGLICASQTVINFLINHAKSFIYSTGVSPLVVEQLSYNLEQIHFIDQKRLKLWSLLQSLKLEFCFASESPIGIKLLGAEEKAIQMQMQLEKQGLVVGVMRWPTVARDQAVVRYVVKAHHSLQDIKNLFKFIN